MEIVVSASKVEAAEKVANSSYIGEVGGKIKDVEAAITMVRETQSHYISYMVKFVTTEGNELTWFASNLNGMEVGQKVVIKSATVKDHREFNGVKQTQITRAKLA